MSRRNGLRPVTLGKPGFQIPQKARIMATLFQFNPFHIRGETYMAKIHWGLACLLLFVTAAVAQEHYTEGPVWRVTLVRVKPAQMDAYLTSLRQATKPLLEEEKRTGAIVDYKIFLKETTSGPQDWDLALAIEYKNHAAMDGLTAKGEAVRDKIMGGKQQAQQVAEKRQEIREVVSSVAGCPILSRFSKGGDVGAARESRFLPERQRALSR